MSESKNPEALRIIARQMENAETFRTDELGIEAASLRDSADEIERLRAREASLKKALEHIADVYGEDFYAGEIARAALGEEKK